MGLLDEVIDPSTWPLLPTARFPGVVKELKVMTEGDSLVLLLYVFNLM
jgi:hypothetical protein